MIETCPPIQNSAQQQQLFRNQNQPPNTNLVNNMMKIMHKKGLINDLARVPLYMDLSSTKSIDTINTILKPLETMTKTLNISVRKRTDLVYPKQQRQTAASSTVPAVTAGTADGVVGTTAQAAPEDMTMREPAQQHSGITSDVLGLNIAADTMVSETASVGPSDQAESSSAQAGKINFFSNIFCDV